MSKPAIILAALVMSAAQLATSNAATAAPKPNQIVSFTDLHNAVDAGLIEWNDCKPGPTGNKTVSVADYERYVQHSNVPLPKNQLIDYAQVLKYARHSQSCRK